MEAYRQSQRVYVDLVKEIIEQIQREEKTVFADIDPLVVAYTLLGMCNWAVIWFRKDGKYTIDDTKNFFYRLVTEGNQPQFGKK